MRARLFGILRYPRYVVFQDHLFVVDGIVLGRETDTFGVGCHPHWLIFGIYGFLRRKTLTTLLVSWEACHVFCWGGSRLSLVVVVVEPVFKCALFPVAGRSCETTEKPVLCLKTGCGWFLKLPVGSTIFIDVLCLVVYRCYLGYCSVGREPVLMVCWIEVWFVSFFLLTRFCFGLEIVFFFMPFAWLRWRPLRWPGFCFGLEIVFFFMPFAWLRWRPLRWPGFPQKKHFQLTFCFCFCFVYITFCEPSFLLMSLAW